MGKAELTDLLPVAELTGSRALEDFLGAKGRLRPGNQPLEMLAASCTSGDKRLADLSNRLPDAASLLFEFARREAKGLYLMLACRGITGRFRALRASSPVGQPGKLKELVLSVLDLALVLYFGEVQEYCEDKAAASFLTDALLFQAVGALPDTPPYDDLAFRETQTYRLRGLPKYGAAGAHFVHTEDPAGWLFGREVSEIITGRHDIAILTPAELYSLPVRAKARVVVKFTLYGTAPSEQDIAEVHRMYDLMSNGLRTRVEQMQG